MNTKALITTLAILGSASSLAVASPSTQYSASASWSYGTPVRTYPAPTPVRTVRGWHYAPPVRTVVRNRYESDWTSSNGWGYQQPRATLLADGLTYNAGEYRKDIVLQGRGRFNALTLNAEGGRTFIEVVKIEFMGGAVQTIPVNRSLCNDESLTFDLDGNDRAINRIFVYRHDGPDRSTAFRSQGEFSVTGL
jgi:hypothetical protein